MKRIAFALLILSAAVLCLACPRTSLAGAEYSGGTGDPNDPYQIASAADLLTLAADTGNYGKYFILTADINLTDYTFTTAVIAPDIDNSSGDYDGIDFTGDFNGNGHIISNLTINTGGAPNDYLGLFGSILGGSVKNLRLENVAITGGDDSECLGGLAGQNVGNIVNCVSNGSITSGIGSFCLGGLIGYNDHGDINDSSSSFNINGGSNSDWLSALVGLSNYGVIINCSSTGEVTGGNDSLYLGGLIGGNWSGTTSRCYSTASITGANSYVGGLIGDNWNSAVSDCFSTGSVISGDDSNFVGGLAGDNDGGSIGNCYSVGIATAGGGSANIGGLIGDNYDDGIINSSYFLDTAGLDNGFGVPLTDTQMKLQASFVGWDFVNIWHISEGVDYPKLGAIVQKYSGGSGTADDPYKIANVADLLALAANTGDYDKYFILTEDVNLGSHSFTTAVIAPPGFGFTGVFNGNGHTIRNLTINTIGTGNDYLGLFGNIGSYGEVKNLRLESVNITSGNISSEVGGLVGWNGGYIDNCFVTGNISDGNNSDDIGGLVGVNWGSISECYSTVAVNSGNNSENLGGLVGVNAVEITKCSSTGTVSATGGSRYIGGLAGYNSSHLSKCYSTGAVSGGDNSVGLGGLVGFNGNGNIENCYSVGIVTGGAGSTNLGGLVGDNYDGFINNSYFLNAAGPNNGYGTPLTNEQMKQRNSFDGWDFDNIWHICESTNYPKFIRQMTPGDITCPDGVDTFDLAAMCDQWFIPPKFTYDLYPPGGDGIVNFGDFAVIAKQWELNPDIYILDAFADEWLGGIKRADLWPQPSGDGIVNFQDFTVLANHWLEGL